MIDTGKMRHLITIQSRTDGVSAVDAANTATWATRATAWAAIDPMSGNELFRARQASSSVNTKMTIRYFPTVVAGDRVLWGTRYYSIEAVRNVEEGNAFMELTCTEIV